jgi:hypothetical protein
LTGKVTRKWYLAEIQDDVALKAIKTEVILADLNAKHAAN